MHNPNQKRGTQMLRKQLLILCLLVLGITLAACEGVTITFDDAADGAPEAAVQQAVELAAAPVVPVTFTNFVWQWSELAESNPASQSVVPDPANYTVTFQDDGSLVVKADCNNGTGSYTRAVDSDSLSIELGAMTAAFCGEASLDNQFMQLLSTVNAYTLSNGRLSLFTSADAEMRFTSGGPSPLAQEVGLMPSQISLDTQGLPYSWQASLVPGTPYDASLPPGPTGIPGHMVISFGVVNPNDAQPNDPVMLIIPAAAYEQQWLDNDNETVSRTMEAIFGYTVALPAPAPTSSMPVLPVEATTGVNDVATQVDRAGATAFSATKNGYRFVGRFAQDANPITSDGLPLRYIYQGFTNDADYLVAFFYPVTTDTLPTNAEVDADWNEALSQDGGAQSFLDQQIADLNALSPSDWQPDLDTLDAVVQSLQISGMPSNAVIGQSWQLSADTGTDAAIVNSDQYTISYRENGTFNYTTDCNNGSGVYIVNGLAGVTGPIAMNAQASTLMACPPDSAHDLFVGTLAAAQDFKVRPGVDKALELVRPAGGGSLVFTPAGPVEEIVPPPDTATATPLPELPTATPAPPTATPAPSEPYGIITAPRGVNIRSGPGTVYPVVDSAEFGDVIAIVGRSADRLWWASPSRISPTGLGWVSADYVNAFNVSNVPVLPAPPVPPTATPVPTATPQPTAVPTATSVPSISFTADSTVITQGSCTTLRWSVENVQAVWVYPAGQPYNQYPVPGNGTQQVCPQTTTTYEMRVQLTDGSVQFRQVTVQVNPQNPLANSNWSVARFGGFGVPLPGTSLTASFGGTGTFNANGGCNSYGGTYTINGNNIQIGPLAGTQIACGDDIDQQEALYVTSLQAASRYELRDGGTFLVLFDAGGVELLSFNRQP